MADTTWTDSQRAALYDRGHTLLVSAAAGSGKTAVLTQRIVDILTNEGGDISKFLIVTFTRAAASEMRERISAALSKALLTAEDKDHLSKQLMLLGGAHISTIDSFYMDLVKSNFQATDMPPRFRLADDAELAPLRREVMDETVDRMFEREPQFGTVSDIFCNIRQESSLSEALLAVYERLNKYPESINILLRSADEIEAGANDILHTKFGEIWKNTVERYAKFGLSLLDDALATMATEKSAQKLTDRLGPLYHELRDHCANALSALAAEDYDTVRREIGAPLVNSTGKGGYPAASEKFKVLRPLVAEFRDTWNEEVLPLGAYSPTEITETAAESAAVLRLLYNTFSLFRDQYREVKQQREIAEFSDVSRAAYKLLVSEDGTPTPLARRVAEKYDAIYIDEYQDVDAMQDATFKAIAKPNNRFMVGDIKQSIYRFRGAQPAVFAGYRKSFTALDQIPPTATEAKVFMSDCFRCDKKIVDFSNTVSGYLFSNNAESIDYKPEDDLHFAKKYEQPPCVQPRCEVMALDREKKDDEDESDGGESVASLTLEAKMIANEIVRLLNAETRINGYPIQPGDIAVLMRSTSLAKPLVKELTSRFVPTNDTSQQQFFENPEILCMFSLLACIDNPMRDVYLAAALRSPFFNFTMEELVCIRRAGEESLSLYEAMQEAEHNPEITLELQQKISVFLTRLGTYRQKAQALPVDKLIRFLFSDTGVMAFAGYEEKENGTHVRKGNLRRLYEYARTFEAGGFKGLYQFIRYVDDIMKNGTKMPAPDGDSNAVSLITIHHSKGLQYPVCFVSGCGSILNSDDLKPQLLSDEYLGCATKLCNAGPFSRTDTFFRKAIALEIQRQNREEEMRVLYVAMTRAKERLYVTGAPRGRVTNLLKRAQLYASPEASLYATKGSSMLEWILTALEHHGHYDDFVNVRTVTEDEIMLRDEIPAAFQMPDTPSEEDIPLVEAPDIESFDYLTKEEKKQIAQDLSNDTDECVDDDCSLSQNEKALRNLLQRRFSYKYPHKHLTRLPTKLSVSQLSESVLDTYDPDAPPYKARQSDLDRLLKTFDRTPCFEEKEPSAAERGTATHEFLQFCDFKNVEKNGLESELKRLLDKRFLPQESEQAVRMNELRTFFNSDFYQILLNARDVQREIRFHISLPAKDFASTAHFKKQLQDEMLTVQGVIDLFFVADDGSLVLCDYKTDRLKPEELADSSKAAKRLAQDHGKQLSVYADALSEICGKRPDKILIYSLHLGKDVDITDMV